MTELHAVSDLQQRYGLASRQAVYDQLSALNIKPVSRGELSTEQLDKLDKLQDSAVGSFHYFEADVTTFFKKLLDFFTQVIQRHCHQFQKNLVRLFK